MSYLCMSYSKIANNSLILYFRLLFSIFIGFFSARIALDELGAEGYGFFAVMAGIVALMNFVGTSMNSTSNRFLATSAEKPVDKTNHLFNKLRLIHVTIAILMIIGGYWLGLVYIQTKLNLGVYSSEDAEFLLLTSLLTVAIIVVSIPYKSLLIVNELFKFLATIELLQSMVLFLGLLVLILFQGNKLYFYAGLQLLANFITSVIYIYSSNSRFRELTRLNFVNIRNGYGELLSFLSWTLIYVLGSILYRQGNVLILNSFYGNLVNASYNIGIKVNSMIFSFVRNLNQAAMPQVMKNEGNGGGRKSAEIVYKLSRITFLIMFVPSLFFIFFADEILNFWLKDVPPYSTSLSILLLVLALVSSLESGFDILIDATGKVRASKVWFNIAMLLALGLSYLFLKEGFSPNYVVISGIIGELLFFTGQLFLLERLTQFRLESYFQFTVKRVLPLIALGVMFYFLPKSIVSFETQAFLYISFKLLLSLLALCLAYLIGFTREEKVYIVQFIKTKLKLS